MMCSTCNTENPATARFCYRCGASLVEESPRHNHYAGHAAEPVRALALVSTLMPHLSGHRHHAYKEALAGAFVLVTILSAIGLIGPAVLVAALALPLLMLIYQYDHGIWANEPVRAIVGGVLAAGLYGAALGWLEGTLTHAGALAVLERTVSFRQIALSGLVVGALTAAGLGILTTGLVRRSSDSPSVDAINYGSVVGFSLAPGESLVIQRGAFGIGLWGGDPAKALVLAATLGLVKPVVYATAAALSGLSLRSPRSASTVVNILLAAALVLAWEVAEVLAAPYGSEGLVLTLLVGTLLASVGLLRTRVELHGHLLSEATASLGQSDLSEAALAPGRSLARCPHCMVSVLEGARFCLVCGTALATAARLIDTSSSDPTARS